MKEKLLSDKPYKISKQSGPKKSNYDRKCRVNLPPDCGLKAGDLVSFYLMPNGDILLRLEENHEAVK